MHVVETHKRISPSSVPVRQTAIRHTGVQLVWKGAAEKAGRAYPHPSTNRPV